MAITPLEHVLDDASSSTVVEFEVLNSTIVEFKAVNLTSVNGRRLPASARWPAFTGVADRSDGLLHDQSHLPGKMTPANSTDADD